MLEINLDKISPEVINDKAQLRDLCRKEVEKFNQYLIDYGGEWSDGLSRFEKYAIEGYLYQKIKGHF